MQFAPLPRVGPPIKADFYSDTSTVPTRAMLEAMVAAPVGDEQKGEDPTTTLLCDRVAALLGKEAAVLLPSGTMCNQIGLRVHCAPGDEVICSSLSHIINAEAGGAAALSGAMVRAIDTDDGMFTADHLHAAVRAKTRYTPRSRLLAVEQTTNLGGGGIWPVAQIDAVAAAARGHGLGVHMDGARLFNACVAAGVAPSRMCRSVDTVWVDLSKGLGSFAGAVLAGSAAFIDQAWRLKQQWGGAFRQSGFIAAAALYALDNNIDRLADDHRRAALIGKELSGCRQVARVLPVQSNIVIFDIAEGGPSPGDLAARLMDQQIRIGAGSGRRVRIVTHLGVDDDDVDQLCTALRVVLGA